MSKVFFRAGEFAKLCGVKKDTLLHYDKIGILKPERVGENGYRYYSVRQFYTFDLISGLKRLGMPLSEIKHYLDRRSPTQFLALLREQQSALEQERARLDVLERLLEETIYSTELAQKCQPGQIEVRYCMEEFYVAVNAPVFETYDEPQFLLRVRSLLEWSRKNGGLSLAPGDVIEKDSLLQNSFVEDYYYCKVTPETASSEQVHKKPAGTYAILYHQGGYETLSDAYRQLRNWVLAQGYRIAGNLYEEDLLHYMSTADPQAYLMKISVQIDF